MNSDTMSAIASEMLPPHLADVAPAKLCEKLARRHYENFTVGSIFMPRALRRHIYNIYAYCRVCDDLADETGDPELSLQLLGWWRDELNRCYEGEPGHPIFQALKETIDEFDLPKRPFDDLISAFIQDQQVSRYATFDDLLDYCSRSANPVGRLVLYLLGYSDAERQQLSDLTCTALQLANFWQDVAIDYAKGRIYIPQEDMARFGYTEGELRNHVMNASFVRLMRFEIQRTRELFERGAELNGLIAGVGAADVELFSRGGMSLLLSIERRGYNVLRKRITVPALKKAALVTSWAARHARRKLGKAESEG